MSGDGGRRPPRLAERMLRAFLPGGVVGESIVGDAREEYAERVRRRGGRPARRWYWWHVARVVTRCALEDAKERAHMGRDVEMGTLLKDLRFGARALLRMPGSAVISIVVLALGIGLCSSMFSIVYGLYFRGLGVPEDDRIFFVWETQVARGQLQRNVPVQNYVDWRARQTAFEDLMAHTTGTVNVSPGDAPVRFNGAFVSANAFGLLRVQPILGRGFAVGEDAPGAPPNLVLGYDAWRDRFGMDPDVIGREVRVNGEAATILGVMPDGFEYPARHEVYVPLRLDPLASDRGNGPFVTVVGRLRDGVTVDEARLDMASVAQQLAQEYPAVNEGVGVSLETPVEANSSSQLNMVFGAMMVAVLCVLLVACANVANLLLARAAMRTREAGIRVAMGGGRLRVMLPFFAEALVLAGAGALLGIGVAYVGVDWFDTVTDPARTGRPYFMRFVIDAPILLFVVGLTVVTALAAGLAPAFQVSRTDVSSVLKDEGRGSSSLHLGRLSRVLVTAEVALSCALLVSAGLMAKSIANVGQVEYDYPTEELFTARVGLFPTDYPERADRQRFWDDLVRELRSLPGVERVGLASSLPHGGTGMTAIAIDGVEYADVRDLPSVNRVVAGTGYFATLGVTPIGRDFVEQDDLDSERVAIVNQPLAERLFEGQSPIGRQFREGAADTLPPITIVGVVPDLHMQGALPQAFPGFEPAGYYVPLRQNDPSFLSMAALPRAGGGLALTPDIRAAVRRVDGDLPIYDVRTQAEVIDRGMWFYGVFGTVFIVFGAAALFMASVGLYGVLSFAVSRRTQEMGIRMALGAGARQVVGLVARQGAVQVGIGLGVGVVLAFLLSQPVGLLLYDVDGRDPAVFLTVVLSIVAVSAAAAFVPARRATGVDPVEALRAE